MSLLDGYQNIYNHNIFVFALSATDYSPFQLYHQAQETILIEDDVREDHRTLSALMLEKGTYVLSPERLSKTWGIGLPAAKRTLLSTTQRGVRSTLYPCIVRRYPTGYRPLRYPKLPHSVFLDTL
jgi:hypothetical protein